MREEHYRLGYWQRDGLTKKGNAKWIFRPVSNEVRYFDNPPKDYRVSIDKQHPEKHQWYRRISLHMPKAAARIWNRVYSVTVQRLKDISAEDAIAEGLKAITKDGNLYKYGIPDKDGLLGTDNTGWPWSEWEANPKEAFFILWKKVYGPESLKANPWVWVVKFKQLSTTGKPKEVNHE